MKLRHKIIACIIVSIIFVGLIPLGFNVAAVSAGTEWRGLLWRGETHSRKQRMQIAKGLLETVYGPMNAYIPNPKPSERERVEKEKRDVRTLLRADPSAHVERRAKLEHSPEYCLITIKHRLEGILIPLRAIAKGGANLALRDEMARWAEVVYGIVADTNEIDNSLLCLTSAQVIDAGKVPGLEMIGTGHDYWFMKTVEASTILETIIIPYLKNEIKK